MRDDLQGPVGCPSGALGASWFEAQLGVAKELDIFVLSARLKTYKQTAKSNVWMVSPSKERGHNDL